MASKTLQYTNTGAQGAVSGTVWSICSAVPSNVSISSTNANPTTLLYPDYYLYSSTNAGLTGLLGYVNVKVCVSMVDSLNCSASASSDLYFTCKFSSASLATTATTQTGGIAIYSTTTVGNPAYPSYVFTLSPAATTGFTISPSLPAISDCSINVNAGYEFSTTNNGGTMYTLGVEVTDKGVAGGTNSPCIVNSPTKTFYIKAPITCTLTASITIS
jgi:hypothetical protein